MTGQTGQLNGSPSTQYGNIFRQRAGLLGFKLTDAVGSRDRAGLRWKDNSGHTPMGGAPGLAIVAASSTNSPDVLSAASTEASSSS